MSKSVHLKHQTTSLYLAARSLMESSSMTFFPLPATTPVCRPSNRASFCGKGLAMYESRVLCHTSAVHSPARKVTLLQPNRLYVEAPPRGKSSFISPPKERAAAADELKRTGGFLFAASARGEGITPPGITRVGAEGSKKPQVAIHPRLALLALPFSDDSRTTGGHEARASKCG